MAALLGVDVEKMINGEPVEFRLRKRIVDRAMKLREELDDGLAVAVVNRLAEATKR